MIPFGTSLRMEGADSGRGINPEGVPATPLHAERERLQRTIRSCRRLGLEREALEVERELNWVEDLIAAKAVVR